MQDGTTDSFFPSGRGSGSSARHEEFLHIECGQRTRSHPECSTPFDGDKSHERYEQDA